MLLGLMILDHFYSSMSWRDASLSSSAWRTVELGESMRARDCQIFGVLVAFFLDVGRLFDIC